MSDLIDAFLEGLDTHAAAGTTTTTSAVNDQLASLIVEPAVGVPVDGLGVDLDRLGVTTDPTPAQLAEATTGITPATLGVARYGSILISSGQEGTEAISLYPRTHIAIIPASSIVADLDGAFSHLDSTLGHGISTAVLATGPSATADMGALVYGAHGPTDVHVLVVADR